LRPVQIIFANDSHGRTSVSKAVIECVNGALDTIAQLHQDWDDRFTFHRPNLLERYLDGRIDFYLEFRIRGPSEGN